MVGLVDKLRNYAKKHAAHDAERILVVEAADEIERLRKENIIYAEAAELVRKASHLLAVGQAGPTS